MGESPDTPKRGPSASRSGDAKPAKRNRITVACTGCRQRKSRCDGIRPKCRSCDEYGLDCVYAHTETLTKFSASKEIVGGLESRVATVEDVLAQLSSRVSNIESQAGDRAASMSGAQHAQPFSVNIALELPNHTAGMRTTVFADEEDSGFFGPTSNIAFTRQVVRTTTVILEHAAAIGNSVSPEATALKSHVVHMDRPASPARILNVYNPNNAIREGTEPFILPPGDTMLQLVNLYFRTTGALYPFIDRNGFMKNLRQLVASGILSVRRSWLGLLNMVFAITKSANSGLGLAFTPEESATKSDVFFQRAMIISDRQIRHGTSLEIVQMLLLASMHSQGTERSMETWTIHGLAVKAAYQLGLHSPDALRQYSPVEREVRKRVWFTCVILDRTLSMTMGRPVSIPESFVRVSLPQVIEDAHSSIFSNDELSEDPASVHFFAATITLYKLMGDVFDVLYGSNVGLGGASDVYDIASHLLQYEQKLVHWQQKLHATTQLIAEEELSRPPADFATAALRIVLTSRFLNLRLLTHRPLLCKYLEIIGSSQVSAQQLITLRQVGANSIRICVQSAELIIKMTHWVLQHTDSQRQLLGSWWSALYYAFNAALVIHSALLIQHQTKYHNQTIPMEELQLSISSLYKAIECLSWLYKGNRMTETCVRYMSALAHQLTLILQLDRSPQTDVVEMLQETLARNPGRNEAAAENGTAHDGFDLFEATDLQLGLELDDFWQHSNVGFSMGFPESGLPGNSFQQ